MSKRTYAMLILMVSYLFSSSASAADGRCPSWDQLSREQGPGRNAWARKCGYISARWETLLNLGDPESGVAPEYQVFTEGCAFPERSGGRCTRAIPYNESAACISGLTRLGSCPMGCYSTGQRVAFRGELTSVEKAQASLISTVTAVSQASSNGIHWAEQQIKAYVMGETIEELYRIETDNGEKLEITANHPLVRANGEVTPASVLHSGDSLLNARGQSVRIKSIATFSYSGTVWNVRPQSMEKTENIFNAEGLLSGSVRFQNEWADIRFRLSNRDDYDVRGL